MRPIKFRAWIPAKWYTDKKGRLGTPFDLHKELTTYQKKNRFDKFENTAEFEQWTGLLDKNGKEIYEGDIVKDQKKEPNIGQIFWHQASFRIEWQMRSHDGTRPVEVCTDDCFGYAEVIGNIHENPELLTP